MLYPGAADSTLYLTQMQVLVLKQLGQTGLKMC